MKTWYFWDWEQDQISFLSLLNKDKISRGSAKMEDGKIVVMGKSYFKGGSNDFKKNFETGDGGKQIDLFYRKTGIGWTQGHLIEYQRKNQK
nr:hypothetical protein [Bacteroidota bacterium]